MEYPHCTNLETVLGAVSINPEFKLDGSPELRFVPLPTIQEASDAMQLFLEDRLGDFLHPEPGKIHGYLRVQRIPRLADGEYEVMVPEHTVDSFGKEIAVPQKRIVVQHTREHHPIASFDPERWDQSKERTDRQYDENTIGSSIKSLVNVDLTAREVASVFSDLRIAIDAPEGWEEAVARFEEFHRGQGEQYIKGRDNKIQRLLKDGKSPRGISNIIAQDDADFVEANRGIVRPFIDGRTLAMEHVYNAANKLLLTYIDMTQFSPFIPTFKKNTVLIVDSQGRGLNHDNLGVDRPIYSSDLANNRLGVEDIPFNEQFHSLFRERILGKKEERRPYQVKAKSILSEAYALLADGHYPAALTRAQTALEVALSGFVIERGVATEEEFREKMPTLRALTGDYFDAAVRKDEAYRGRSRFFDRSLRNRLVSSENTNGAPSLQDIRNMEVHRGGVEGAHSHDGETAVVGCSVYAEAVSFVLNEGWKERGAALQSNVFAWAYTHALKGRLPDVPATSSIHSLERGLDECLKYVDQKELDWLKRNTPTYSWAHDRIQKA